MTLIEEREDACGLCQELFRPGEEIVKVDEHLVHRTCYEREIVGKPRGSECHWPNRFGLSTEVWETLLGRLRLYCYSYCL